jgi:hypothetical protein
MDLLRRVLKYEGYKLKGVMNITDVGHLMADSDDGEDKMAKSAREQNKDPYEIADFYTQVFFKDFEKLNISKPEVFKTLVIIEGVVFGILLPKIYILLPSTPSTMRPFFLAIPLTMIFTAFGKEGTQAY